MTYLESMTRDHVTSETKPQTEPQTEPQTKPQIKPETFRSHLPAIAAATTGTVLATILGSLIGAAGTIVGMVIGSLASGTCSWWAERAIRRSATIATARADAIRARGRQLHPSEDAAVTRVATAMATRPRPRQNGRPDRRRRWAGPAAFIAVAFIGCALVVTMIEGAAGKPLSAVTQDRPGHGTTFGGGAVGPASPASPSPATSGSSSPAASASATGTGATTPATSSASGSPSASTTPTPTDSGSTAPASPAPSTTVPAATPAGTPAP